MADVIKNVSEPLEKSASVDRVFGEPIRVGEHVVVPVARVAYAYGGGWGTGTKRATEVQPSKEGEGGGGGGAVSASPVGFLEITETETRFVRFFDYRPLLAASLLGLGLGLLLGRRGK